MFCRFNLKVCGLRRAVAKIGQVDVLEYGKSFQDCHALRVRRQFRKGKVAIGR